MKKGEAETRKEIVENETKQFEKVKVFQEVELTQKEVRTDSYFDGGLIELIGWRLLSFLITIVTLGIAGPWGECMLYSYQIKHTVYNGKRLKFEGTGGDLFVNKFKWALLTIITLGIYAIFIPIKKTKWVISNIHFEDEEFIKEESFFDGKTIQLIGLSLLCNFLNIITLGLVAPFTTCLKLRWINKHTVINRKKLSFNGKAIGLFGKQMLWSFFTIITFGIYGLWLPIKILKWKSKHIHIKVVDEVEEKDKSLLIAIPIVIIVVALLICIVPNVIQEINSDEGVFNDLFLEINSEFGTSINGTSGKKDNSLSQNAVNSKVPSNSKDSSAPNSNTSSSTTSSKKTSTSVSTSGATSSTKRNNYPTLSEISGDYSINIKENRYENGNKETLDASGVETISVSGGKIKYLTYTMSYDASTGYAYSTSNKYSIEAYFEYKNGRINVEMLENIYNDSGYGIKIERSISGNRL